jgi:hypothetical protein
MQMNGSIEHVGRLDDNGDIGENGAFLRSEVINKWETRTR